MYEVANPNVSEEKIQEYLSGGRKFSEKKDPAPKATYTMAVRGVYGRTTATGKQIASVMLGHTGDNAGRYQAAYVDLFRSKENPEVNAEVSQKFLTIIAAAAGVTGPALSTVTFSVDGESAQILADQGNGWEPITLSTEANEVLVRASLKVESFTRRDGSIGTKNTVSGLYPIEG